MAQLTQPVRDILAQMTRQIDHQLQIHGQDAAGRADWSSLLLRGRSLGTGLRHLELLMRSTLSMDTGRGDPIDDAGEATGEAADEDMGRDDGTHGTHLSEDQLPGEVYGPPVMCVPTW